MKDYCTLRSLVVRVQARMYIFWKFDILGFLSPTTTTPHDTTTTRKHLILVSPPPGDEIPREDLPSLLMCDDVSMKSVRTVFRSLQTIIYVPGLGPTPSPNCTPSGG